MNARLLNQRSKSFFSLTISNLLHKWSAKLMAIEQRRFCLEDQHPIDYLEQRGFHWRDIPDTLGRPLGSLRKKTLLRLMERWRPEKVGGEHSVGDIMLDAALYAACQELNPNNEDRTY